mmetsp:Transcript_25828/g.65121  ORF Transcript_25828/g.65121 Transcript_25828/m.65121 type:complete len:460 (+) Transcript_25828:3-1382(+)
MAASSAVDRRSESRHRSWRSVLPTPPTAKAAAAAARFLSRPASKQEAAAKQALHRALIDSERVCVHVAGLHGISSVGNGLYEKTLDKWEGFAIYRLVGGSTFIFYSGKESRWRLGPSVPTVPLAPSALLASIPDTEEAGDEATPWAISPVVTAGVLEPSQCVEFPGNAVPPGGHWGSASGGFATITVYCKGALRRILSAPSWHTTQSNMEVQAVIDQLSDFPRIFGNICCDHHITLPELEKILLPDWRLNASFAGRSTCLEALRVHLPGPDCLGELHGLSVQDPTNSDQEAPVYGCARWAELLDNTIHIRLMSSEPAYVPSGRVAWADVGVAGAALRALRAVRWRPALHEAFPARHRARMDALIDLGRCLGFHQDGLWSNHVLPFLSDVLADPETANNMCRIAERVEYLSQSRSVWLPCRIIAVEPVSGAVRVSVRPGHWLVGAEQAHRVRRPAFAATS